MEFIEKNKKIVVPVVAGVLIAVILDWADVPVWIIGGVVAAVVALWTRQMIEAYDTKIAPKINERREGR
ncbi:hypothetical protein [Lentibacter sp. XHP0401]|jgi:uncharacterized membrane protein|uniref:hypothetical protein n=1 Tax=Lentibacter sp. XHP0401 TaxID=2984334 RepID=UPI0021E8381B|nr:hypothetical protein [Lentibacter sp. XHP0401]MCV2892406.1 hypothetical protein [Lentibacter sp. XHP0401]